MFLLGRIPRILAEPEINQNFRTQKKYDQKYIFMDIHIVVCFKHLDLRGYLTLEPSSKLNICALKCQHLFGTLFAVIFCSGADYALFFCYLEKFSLNFVLIQHYSQKNAETPNGAIWDEFSVQQNHQNIKKHHI